MSVKYFLKETTEAIDLVRIHDRPFGCQTLYPLRHVIFIVNIKWRNIVKTFGGKLWLLSHYDGLEHVFMKVVLL